MQIPGVPVVYALRTALLLEAPSVAQRQFVKTSEEQRLHMTDLEFKMLEKRAKNMLEKDSSDEDVGSGDQNLEVQAVEKKRTARRDLGVKDKPQFKRKKAKVGILINLCLLNQYLVCVPQYVCLYLVPCKVLQFLLRSTLNKLL